MKSVMYGLLATLCTAAYAHTDAPPAPSASHVEYSSMPDPGKWVQMGGIMPSAVKTTRDPLTASFTYGCARQLTFVPGFSVARFGSETVSLSQPVMYYDGDLFVSKEDVPIIRPMLQVRPAPRKTDPPQPRAAQRKTLVVIDPGHGGRDTGAIANGLLEKDINISIARALKQLLEAKGYQVKLTRSDDRFIELDDRPDVANRCQADFLISIHANSERTGSITGIETFYCGNDSRQFAGIIQQSVADHAAVDSRGTKSGRLRVLRYANCPAVLVEVGFMSNRGEARRLADPDYQKRLAAGIANGLAKYISRND